MDAPGFLQDGELRGSRPRLRAPPPALPNIVYVLADDLGWGDLDCYNPDSAVPTPFANKLAAAGRALHRHAFALGGVHAHALRHSHRPLLLALAA